MPGNRGPGQQSYRKDAGVLDEMLLRVSEHFVQGQHNCYVVLVRNVNPQTHLI